MTARGYITAFIVTVLVAGSVNDGIMSLFRYSAPAIVRRRFAFVRSNKKQEVDCLSMLLYHRVVRWYYKKIKEN